MRAAALLAAGLVWLCPGTATLAATELALSTQRPPGTYVWVGNHRLHIDCRGQGSPTVVFDSGLGGTSLDWSRVHDEVAGLTRACVYDRAGYGWSDRGPGPRHSARIVSELERLLGYGSIAAPYVLVGHSFGGLNVRLFARKHPERIAGLVLVDSSHEDQFRRFEQAGLRGIAPQSHQFVLRNYQLIPDSLPPELRDLAQTFALSANSTASLHSELANLQLSATQAGAYGPLPDVPLVVISRNIDSQSATSGRSGRLANVWLEMQQELATRTARGHLVIASTPEHHIQLSEPGIVVDAVREVILEAAGGASP